MSRFSGGPSRLRQLTRTHMRWGSAAEIAKLKKRELIKNLLLSQCKAEIGRSIWWKFNFCYSSTVQRILWYNGLLVVGNSG